MSLPRIIHALVFSLFLCVHAYGDGSVTIITPVHDQKFEIGETIPIEWTDQSSTPVPIIIYANHQHSSSQTTIEGLMSDTGSASIIGGLPSPGYWDIIIFFEIELASVRIIVEEPPTEPPQDGESIGYFSSSDPYRRRGDEDRMCCEVIQYSGRTHLRYHTSGFDASGPHDFYNYTTLAQSHAVSSFIRQNVELALDIYHTPPEGDTYLKATFAVPDHSNNLTYVIDNITCENGRYDGYLRVVSSNNSASFTETGPTFVFTYRPALVVGDTRYVLSFNISGCLGEGGPPGSGGEGEWTREDIDQLLTISDDTLGDVPDMYDADDPGDGHDGIANKLTEFIGLFPDPDDIPEEGHPTWTITLPGPPGEEDFEIYIDLRPDLDHPIGQHLETVRVILRLLFVLLITYKFIWMVLHVLRQY